MCLNFEQDTFPDDVKHLPAGDLILNCWKRKFETAKEALVIFDRSLKYYEFKGARPTFVEKKGSMLILTGLNSRVDGVGGKLEPS